MGYAPSIDDMEDNSTPKMGYTPHINDVEEIPKEGIGTSMVMALPRMAGDALQSSVGFVKDIPGFISNSAEQIPNVFNTLMNDPIHSARQVAAGVTQLGHNLLNTPKNIADYESDRLNLLPKKIAEMIPSQRDITPDINQWYGEPSKPGDEYLRNAVENSLNVLGSYKAMSLLNPMKLTKSGIAKSIAETGDKNYAEYAGPGGKYSQLSDEAKSRGITGNQINPNQNDLDILKEHLPPDEQVAIDKLMTDKNLTNAQNAISQLGYRDRKLTAKSQRGDVLTDPEKDLQKAVRNVKNNIQENMFKDQNGQVHDDLVDAHKQIQQGYATEVIPYTKNRAIQRYKAGKLKASGLVNSLSSDNSEFNAMRGSYHPAMGLNKAINSFIRSRTGGTMLGMGGAYGGYSLLHKIRNSLLGNNDQ